MPNLKLADITYGILNNISENDSNASGDRRRTSPTTALRFATEKAFEINTLTGMKEFNGIVLHQREVTYASYQNRASLLATFVKVANEEQAENVDFPSFVYKVLIPELEPRPTPLSLDDPVIATYPDIYTDFESETPLEKGQLVVIKYEDVGNLFNPRIIRKTGKSLSIGGCEDIENAQKSFKNGKPKVLGVGGEAKNNYPPVRQRAKTGYNPDYSSFAKRVSSVGSENGFSEPAILSVISIAKKEQGLSGGFNYNHWGIMADVGKGWGSTGRKYIDGSFSSTEGSGGVGIRTSKTRYFASFETEKNGILFMLTKLSERGFQNVTSGKSFANLYYRKWLAPGDESRIQELLERNESSLTSYYENAKSLIDS